MKWIESLYQSLFNNEHGFSGRKLTAMTLNVIVIIGDIKFLSLSEETIKSLLIEWVICHFAAIAFFLGLITIANIIELKNGKKNEVQ